MGSAIGAALRRGPLRPGCHPRRWYHRRGRDGQPAHDRGPSPACSAEPGQRFEVRGEVYMPKAAFARHQRRAATSRDRPTVSPTRATAAAGSLRQQDPRPSPPARDLSDLVLVLLEEAGARSLGLTSQCRRRLERLSAAWASRSTPTPRRAASADGRRQRLLPSAGGEPSPRPALRGSMASWSRSTRRHFEERARLSDREGAALGDCVQVPT